MDNDLHHFVPQFYLRRFVGSDGLLWVYDKDTDRTFGTNPKNVAAAHGFYKLPDHFPDSSVMEGQLSEIENEANLITEDWLSRIEPGGFVEIPEINREIMALYLSIQLIRTSEARTLLLQAIPDSRGLPDEGNARKDLHLALMWDEELVERLSSWVEECSWVFRLNSLPQSLYTSDDPIKVQSRTHHLHWGQAPVEGAYLLMPLTPRVLMYCFDRNEWGTLQRLDGHVIPIPLEAELLRNANIQQVGHAQRFVFSDKDDFQAARDFSIKYPGSVGQHRPRFDGG